MADDPNFEFEFNPNDELDFKYQIPPPGPPETLSNHDYMMHGVRLLMSSLFEQGRDWFEARKEADLRIHVCYAYSVLTLGMVHRNQAMMHEAVDIAWTLEALARNSLNDHRILSQLAQAEALMVGSVGQFMTGSYIKGAWNMRSAYKGYQTVWKEVTEYNGPDKKDLAAWCSFGEGTFNLFCSMLPPTALKLASWVGLPGDRQLGLRKLSKAYEANSFYSPMACCTLLMYNTVISLFLNEQSADELAEAEEMLAWAKREYPQGTLFAWFQSRLYRCQGKLREAIVECDLALDRIPPGLPQAFPLLFFYQKGWCAFLMMEWDEALVHFAPAVEVEDRPDNKHPPIKTFYSYQMGVCAAMLGDKDRAMAHFGAVPEFVPKHITPRSIELYSLRKATQYGTPLADPVLDTFELFLVWDGFSQMSELLLRQSLWLLDEAARLHRLPIAFDEQLYVPGSPTATGAVTSLSDYVKALEVATVSGSDAEADAELTAKRSLAHVIVEAKQRLETWGASDWDSAKIARYHLTRGAILRSLKLSHLAGEHYREAIHWALSAYKSRSTQEVAAKDGIVPLAYYFNAMLLLDQSKLDEAQEAYDESAKYSDFDLHDALQFRLHAMNQTISARREVWKQ